MAETRTLQDRDFLVWEVYATGGRHADARNPQVVFHCLTQRDIRPRWLELGEDEADAQRRIAEARPAELLELLESARDIA